VSWRELEAELLLILILLSFHHRRDLVSGLSRKNGVDSGSYDTCCHQLHTITQ
jgi:hypothetical protein